MTHQQTSKKIILYLFCFLILSKFFNKNLSQINFTKNINYEIFSNLQKFENDKIIQNLQNLNEDTIFFLDKNNLSEIIYSNNLVDNFSIFKKYPSNLKINIKKASLLAITEKNGSYFYLGSNGNFIKVQNLNRSLPFVFGDIDIDEFLDFKKVLDQTNFDYREIKNLFFFKSKRWDIETHNGLIIKLPKKKLKSSLELLSKIYKKNIIHNIKMIDLRQNNLIVTRS